MNFQTSLAVGCFAASLIQAAADIAAWRDRLSQKGGGVNAKRRTPIWIVALWAIGIMSTAALGGFLLAYHPDPVVKIVEKRVEVPAVCPPAKSGAATTRGAQAPAITGSNDPVTYGTTPPPK